MAFEVVGVLMKNRHRPQLCPKCGEMGNYAPFATPDRLAFHRDDISLLEDVNRNNPGWTPPQHEGGRGAKNSNATRTPGVRRGWATDPGKKEV